MQIFDVKPKAFAGYFTEFAEEFALGENDLR